MLQKIYLIHQISDISSFFPLYHDKEKIHSENKVNCSTQVLQSD